MYPCGLSSWSRIEGLGVDVRVAQLTRYRSGEALSVFGGTNMSVCCVGSSLPPSSAAVPIEQKSARGSAPAGSGGKSFRGLE
jgi:hypothetical protein